MNKVYNLKEVAEQLDITKHGTSLSELIKLVKEGVNSNEIKATQEGMTWSIPETSLSWLESKINVEDVQDESVTFSVPVEEKLEPFLHDSKYSKIKSRLIRSYKRYGIKYNVFQVLRWAENIVSKYDVLHENKEQYMMFTGLAALEAVWKYGFIFNQKNDECTQIIKNFMEYAAFMLDYSGKDVDLMDLDVTPFLDKNGFFDQHKVIGSFEDMFTEFDINTDVRKIVAEETSVSLDELINKTIEKSTEEFVPYFVVNQVMREHGFEYEAIVKDKLSKKSIKSRLPLDSFKRVAYFIKYSKEDGDIHLVASQVKKRTGVNVSTTLLNSMLSHKEEISDFVNDDIEMATSDSQFKKDARRVLIKFYTDPNFLEKYSEGWRISELIYTLNISKGTLFRLVLTEKSLESLIGQKLETSWSPKIVNVSQNRVKEIFNFLKKKKKVLGDEEFVHIYGSSFGIEILRKEMKNANSKAEYEDIAHTMISFDLISSVLNLDEKYRNSWDNYSTKFRNPDEGIPYFLTFQGSLKPEFLKPIDRSPQDNSLFPYLTLEENVITFGKLYGLSSKQIKERMNYLLNRLDLRYSRHKKINELSGGMQKRADLAVTLIHDPKIIVLDEPFNGLDISLQKFIWELLVEFSKEGKIIIISSHLLADIQKRCTQIGLVEKGIYYDTKELLNTLKSRGETSLESFLSQLFSRR